MSEYYAEFKDTLQAYNEGKEVDKFRLGLLANHCQGTYESDFSFAGTEGSLHNFKVCEKNQGHKDFILFDDFIKSDKNILPENYREQDIFDFIKLLGSLTVKLIVKFISPNRPDVHPRTGAPYSHHEIKGKGETISGTGTVVHVKRENLSYVLTIATARHVVFDQIEAAKTDVQFSVYSSGEPIEKFTKSENGGECTPFNADNVLLTIETKDSNIGENLHRCWMELQEKQIKASEHFNKDKKEIFLPIVSHPHGQDKYVSFGCIFDEDVNPYLERLPSCFTNVPGLSELLTESMFLKSHGVVYNTVTCPGSSGAFIFHTDNIFKYLTGSIHEGGQNASNKENYSGDNSGLEELLRYPDRLLGKEKVKAGLRKYLKDPEGLRDTRSAVYDFGKVYDALNNIWKFAKVLPVDLNADVKRKLDNDRSFDFRRCMLKGMKLFPPGSFPVAARCTGSILEDIKECPGKFLILHYTGLNQFTKTFGKDFEEFDKLTGGDYDTPSSGHNQRPEVSLDELVQRALNIQNNFLDLVRRLSDKLGQEIETLKGIFEDTKNKDYLTKILNPQKNHEDKDEDVHASEDSLKLDQFLDEVWDFDPALLRWIYSLVEFYP